jgi:thymidylate synthase (FAD)
VYPPAADAMTRETLDIEYARAVDFYQKAVEQYKQQGFTRKEAREAARAFLPNCAPVSMVVTGNHRAWRDVLQKRTSTSADKEIQLFAAEILRQLKELAPGCYQDM